VASSLTNLGTYLPSSRQAKRGGGIVAAGAFALAGAAIIVNWRANKAERTYPPRGSFVTTGGVRLHYMERGNGPPVVILHGNGAMVDDIIISGLLDQTRQSHRAVAFDRPGFGHSERPRGHSWSASAQAGLLPEAFALLGIHRPIVVGHSWGTMVALALALDNPNQVSGLVLASGYYYPGPRADVTLSSASATPVLGDVICHTAGPMLGEAMAPAVFRKMFAPQPISVRFDQEFPVALALRPSQVRAYSEDAAHMNASAEELSPRYGSLSCPVIILSGDGDKIVDFERQSIRLHRELAGSKLDIFRGAGHMTHHFDPRRVVRAIDEISPALSPGSEKGAVSGVAGWAEV
jgi:pimeloyl-ACP methyl ester carboxylesterase